MEEKYRVKHGGLMRCCLLSLDDAMVEAKEPPKEGDTHSCKYCKNGMIFRAGAWVWEGSDK
jgi:hypothetical protein